MKLKPAVMLVLVAASMALAACNTVKGAGEDLSSAGKATERTAEDAKR